MRFQTLPNLDRSRKALFPTTTQSRQIKEGISNGFLPAVQMQRSRNAVQGRQFLNTDQGGTLPYGCHDALITRTVAASMGAFQFHHTVSVPIASTGHPYSCNALSPNCFTLTEIAQKADWYTSVDKLLAFSKHFQFGTDFGQNIMICERIFINEIHPCVYKILMISLGSMIIFLQIFENTCSSNFHGSTSCHCSHPNVCWKQCLL